MAARDKNIDCVFCSIVAGDTDSDVVLEEENCVAFLDSRPLFPGHVLLVPRKHVVTLPELPEALVAPLFKNAQRLTRAVQNAMDAEGTFVALNNTVSQSVPHLHVHIVPRRKKDGLRGFFWPRSPYRDDVHRRETAQRIRDALKTSG